MSVSEPSPAQGHAANVAVAVGLSGSLISVQPTVASKPMPVRREAHQGYKWQRIIGRVNAGLSSTVLI